MGPLISLGKFSGPVTPVVALTKSTLTPWQHQFGKSIKLAEATVPQLVASSNQLLVGPEHRPVPQPCSAVRGPGRTICSSLHSCPGDPWRKHT